MPFNNRTFTKRDLKSGMQLTYRNGTVVFLLGVNLLKYNATFFMGNGGYNQSTYITQFRDDLTHVDLKELDIVKVVDRDGTVLFNRKDKLADELESLQNQVAAIHTRIREMQKSL